MFEAMRRARFSIWRIERRQGAIGLMVADVLRKAEAWLVNEGRVASARDGTIFASQLCEPRSFAMAGGVIVPVDGDMIDSVVADPLASQIEGARPWARRRPPVHAGA